MLDVARLGFVVDSGPVKRAVNDLARLGDQSTKTARLATGAAANMNRGLTTSMISLRRVAYAATGAMGAFSGALAGGALIRTSDQYVQMTNGLRVLGLSADQAAEQLGKIADIAKRTRTPLQATTQLYQRVSIASRELGATQEDVIRFTENVGLALAQQGGSAESASGALMQLSQALAGGVVRAEEFNSILEGAYPIAQAAADGIDRAGGSIGKLRQLMLAGEVSSKQFFDAILSQTPKLSAAFAGTVPTVGQAMQVLRDQWTLAVGQMSGGTSALSTAILRLADAVSAAAGFISNNMNQIIGAVSAAATAIAVYYTPAVYGAIRAVTLFGASLITLRGALIATGIGALIVLAGVMIGKFLDLVVATGGWGDALSLLGELAVAVWEGIIGSAGAIPPGLMAVWNQIRIGFYQMISDLQTAWASFLRTIADAVAGMGMDGLAGNLEGRITSAMDASIETSGKAVIAAGEAASAYKAAGGIIANAWAPAKAKIDQIRAGMEKAKAASQQLAQSAVGPMGSVGGAGGVATGGGGSGGAGGGGSQSEAAQAADKATEALEKLRQKHVDLQATMGMSEAQQRIYAAVQELGVGATDAQRQEVERLIPAIDRLQAAQDRLKEVADTLKEGFGTLFRDAVTGAKSLGDALGDLAGKLADMFANQAFNALWGQFGGAITGAVTQSVPSFAGGGFTGRGSRTGGVDGLGGFPAILHRNETVVDHTRRQSAGGMSYSPTFNIGGQVTAEDLAAVRQEAANGFAQMQKALPAQVQMANAKPRRR